MFCRVIPPTGVIQCYAIGDPDAAGSYEALHPRCTFLDIKLHCNSTRAMITNDVGCF